LITFLPKEKNLETISYRGGKGALATRPPYMLFCIHTCGSPEEEPLAASDASVFIFFAGLSMTSMSQ